MSIPYSYNMRIFSPESSKKKIYSIAETYLFVQVWKKFFSEATKSKAKRFSVICNNCQKTIKKNSLSELTFCKTCNKSYSLKAFSKIFVSSQKPKNSSYFQFVNEFGLLSGNVFPSSFVVNTYPVYFINPTLKRLINKSDLSGKLKHFHYLILPHPIYWQTKWTIVLIKTLNFIKKFQDAPKNILHFVKKLMYTNKSKVNKKILENRGSFVHLNFIKNKTVLYKINYILSCYYRKLHTTQLNYNSLTKRQSGKNAINRKYILSKRMDRSARAMILPNEIIKPNEIAIPMNMYHYLFQKFKNKFCLLNRMPSISTLNITGHKIRIWNKQTIGISTQITKGHKADFDGDEMNLFAPTNNESEIEIELLMDPKQNMKAFDANNKIKLHPSQDNIIIFTICVLNNFKIQNNYLKKINFLKLDYINGLNSRQLIRKVFPKNLKTSRFSNLGFFIDKNQIFLNIQKISPIDCLMNILRSVFEIYGSERCFNCFVKLQKITLFLSNIISISFTIDNLKRMLNLVKKQKINSNKFDKIIFKESKKNIFTALTSTGTLCENFHLYQLVGELGIQSSQNSLKTTKNKEYIKSNFFDGLTCHEFIIHCYFGIINMIDLKNVWKDGYQQRKISHNVLDLVIDTKNRVKEKKFTYFYNLLEIEHFEDLISFSTIDFIVKNSSKFNRNFTTKNNLKKLKY